MLYEGTSLHIPRGPCQITLSGHCRAVRDNVDIVALSRARSGKTIFPFRSLFFLWFAVLFDRELSFGPGFHVREVK